MASSGLSIVQPHTPSSLHTKGASQSTVIPTIIIQGWLLKKRRKKMQGFAHRYFTLYQTGLLSYSFEPGKPSRDQLSVPHAAVSTYPGRKDIHIDSHNATFHLKCLSSDDFSKWMVALRRFIAADGRRSSFGLSTPRITNLSRSTAVVDDMGTTLTELETALVLLQSDDTHSKHRASAKKEKQKDKDKDHKDHTKEGGAIFGIFKRSGSHHNDSSHSDTHSDISLLSPQHRVNAALQALKTQHETLVKTLQTLSYLDPGSAASAGPSPLPSTAEEEEGSYQLSPDPQSSGPFGAPFTRKSTRTSIGTTFSDGTTSREWFDAYDGGEEFFIELDEPTPADEKTEIDTQLVEGSRSSLGGSSDLEEDIVAAELLQDEGKEDEVVEMDPVEKARHVARRTELPCGSVGDEGSLFAVLKKNVGKDLASVTFPVTFNEPITLLQNTAEQLEYFDLLRQAAETNDPVERMCYVAAFAVSGYAHTRHRSGRKSFNPMLAETFEDVRMKYIAEKVRHQPFAMAYHAEGEGWELYATSEGKTKFWGKSLEIIPLGTTHLKIGDDHFSWNKPSSFMRNLMMGTKYLEHQGKMTIENKTNRDRCVLEFKQNGYWAPLNQVTGTVLSPSGQAITHLEGKWDEQIAQTLESSSHFRVLWRITPFPKLAEEYYGFTSFGITLNEITEDLEGKLPPTDSRFRPDVRALELGDVEEAEAQKARVEEKQRERRKRGQEMQPRWFKLVGDEWIYKGGYWEARANGWQDANVDPLW